MIGTRKPRAAKTSDEGRASRDRRARARGAISRAPLALVAILIGGLLLRVYAVDAYRPSPMTLADSTAYVYQAAGGLYSDAVRPAGYSLFLRGAHDVSTSLWFTVALQHLAGLATALLLYLTARRLGASRGLSLIPAAIAALSGDWIFLEHTVISEPLFTLLLSGAVYAAIRMLDSGRPALWGAAAGVLLGATATVRTVALVLIPLFALWVVFGLDGTTRRKVVAAAATLAAGIAVLAVYGGFQDRSVGTWSLTRTSGWSLYSRVAPFADCHDFTPPQGTRFLCEATPPDQRQGPDYYGWIGGPARARFGAPPAGDATLKRFARAVVLHQPDAYAKVIVKDFIRYFVPSFGFDRPYNGAGPELYAFDRRAPGIEEANERSLETYYSPFRLRLSAGGVRALASYQELVRVHGILLLELLVLAVAACFLTHGRRRRGAVLVALTTLALMVVPVATTVYSSRYAIPIEGLVGVGAAVGIQALLERARVSRRAAARA